MPHTVNSLSRELERQNLHTLSSAYYNTILGRIERKERELTDARFKQQEARQAVERLDVELMNLLAIRDALDSSHLVAESLREKSDDA